MSFPVKELLAYHDYRARWKLPCHRTAVLRLAMRDGKDFGTLGLGRLDY